MDGNNSLKHIAKIANHQIADLQKFSDSNYFLPTSFVDEFKDEVKCTAPPKHDGISTESEDKWKDIEDDSQDEDIATNVATNDPIKECTKN